MVNYFQRVNTGFYKLEGKGTCELSTARNSDKLFVKHDHWNRGVRGELVKFLQACYLILVYIILYHIILCYITIIFMMMIIIIRRSPSRARQAGRPPSGAYYYDYYDYDDYD